MAPASKPNPKQATLSRFLGLKPPAQPTVETLFAKQTRAQQTPEEAGPLKRRSQSSEPEASSPKKQKTTTGGAENGEEAEEKPLGRSPRKKPAIPKASASKASPKSDVPPEPIETSEETDAKKLVKRRASRKNLEESTQDPKDDAAASSLSSAKSLSKGKGKLLDQGLSKPTSVVESSDAITETRPKKEVEREESEDEDEGHEEIAELITDNEDPTVDRVNWEKGTPVPYASLVHTFNLIDGTTKRLEITKYLSRYLAQVIRQTPDELIKIVYLCINRLCPDYEGIELGIGESILIKAIGSSMGRTPAQVKADFNKVGDLGLVAQNSRTTQKTMFKPKLLTVQSVFADLRTIATTSGQSSQAKKVGVITKMLAACEGEEAKFIIRSLEGKLRIGLAEQTVLTALSTAVVSTGVGTHGTSSKSRSADALLADIAEGTQIVKAVYSEIPSYDLVIPALLKGGVHGLRENCKLTPGVPLKPMLAKPTKSISEVLDRFEGQEFTCEYKYDGERAQIHYLNDGSISIFSRNSENMSVKYPDMVEQLPRAIKKSVTQSFVLDAEAVAWDPIEKKILPFQELSKRKRKDVKSEDIAVKVQIFGFDLLYLNGEPLIKTDLRTRRKLLLEHFEEVEGEFSFAKSVDVDNVEEIQTFLDESVKAGCEGLMVKMLNGQNANYEPSRRSMNWLKVKKDYLAGIGDSLDLVVVGAYFGRGKRTNVYGAFLLACYDAETETYQTICKLGTGFSDEVLESHYQKLKPSELTAKRNYYDGGDSKPDVWLEPKVVWEVLAADLSLSPVYSAARGLCGDGTRGVSLRFPRYIRERDDKGPEDATGPEQVAEMYQRQVTTQDGGAGKGKKKRGKENAGQDDFW